MLSVRLKMFAVTIAAPLMFAAAPAKAADIVDTAAANPEFSILVKMIKAAGLVDTLKGKGPFTVFAPSDAAFGKWPKKEVDLFLNPAKKEHLVRLLKTHVVSGKVMSSDISGSANPATLQGSTIAVEAADGGVTVNGANVVSADVGASNGVIHVIDAVILPPQ